MSCVWLFGSAMALLLVCNEGVEVVEVEQLGEDVVRCKRGKEGRKDAMGEKEGGREWQQKKVQQRESQESPRGTRGQFRQGERVPAQDQVTCDHSFTSNHTLFDFPCGHLHIKGEQDTFFIFH